jgi:hypothetical protein
VNYNKTGVRVGKPDQAVLAVSLDWIEARSASFEVALFEVYFMLRLDILRVGQR